MEDLRQANQQQMMQLFEKVENANKQQFENFIASSNANHQQYYYSLPKLEVAWFLLTFAK
jgi:hypothetical protein